MAKKDDADAEIERITVIAKEFTPAAMEYHRRHMREKGYTIEGPIGRHAFFYVDGPGEAKPLFDGEPQFSATFFRKTSGK